MQKADRAPSDKFRTHSVGHSDVLERQVQLIMTSPNSPIVSFSDSFFSADKGYQSLRNLVYCYARRGIVLLAELFHKFLFACMALFSEGTTSIVSQAQLGFSQDVPMNVSSLLWVGRVSNAQ